LYKGPFLEGFYLDNAPEFERWMSSERAQLAARYEEALTRLANDAEKSGDHAAAVRWRRRLADADPVSSRSALALMRALVAAGDRTAALQHARVYESLVQQELGTAPDPSIVRYAAELRADAEHSTPVALSTPRVEKPAIPPPVIPVVIASADERAIAVQPTALPKSVSTRSNRWWPIAAIMVVTVLGFVLLRERNGEKTPPLDTNRIVIVPFRTSGPDSSVKYLGEGVVDLIAPMLTGEGGPAAVDSRTAISTWNRITHGREGTVEDARQVGRELGAGLILSGSVVETGGKLTITGNVIPGNGGNPRALVSVTAPSDSVDQLLDRFVRQLLVRQSGVTETSIAAITSQSLPAIRAYLSGRAAYRNADEDGAIENFTRALDIDSTFALAALDLTIATGKILRAQTCRLNTNTCRVFSLVPGLSATERTDDLFNRAVRIAWANRSRLGPRDLPLLDALRGKNYPRENSARETMAALQRAVAAAPDRPETHYLLGILLLYQGPALGVPDSRSRAAVAFQNATKLDSSYLAPLARMVDVAAFVRDTAQLRVAGIHYLARDSVGPTADYVRWVVAAGTNDVVAQQKLRARLRAFSRTTLEHIFLTSQMAGLAVGDADTATQILAETATDPIEKSVVFRRGELLALNEGQPARAHDLLVKVAQLRAPGTSPLLFSIPAALFDDGNRALADSQARNREEQMARDTLRPMGPNEVRPASMTLSVLSLWYLDRGDTARARQAADWLRRHAQPRNRVLALLPEMLIASRARRPEGASLRAFVDSVSLDGCCEVPEFMVVVLARAYEESGDRTGALRVVRRGVWYYPPRQVASLLREEGRLANALGDREGAIRAWEHYLALRANPEPVFIPERNRIRAEVDRLKRIR
jgi:tetratricopeptide (TPR) repeat protein